MFDKARKTLLREPLFHFLLLGSIFFLLYQLTVDDADLESADRLQIRISEARIESLATNFEKTWQRLPDAVELDGLVQSLVREEVYYREGLALGLDEDDALVRQRVAQKLRFLMEDLTPLADPTDAELQTYLDANADAYRRSPDFTMRLVYLNPELHGGNIDAEADMLKSRLQSGDVNLTDAGDATLLPQRYESESLPIIGRDMGREFVERLIDVPVGSWQGPLVSSFGLHLVFIEARIDSQMPALEQVRKRVLRDWTSEKRQQLNESGYQQLRKRYQVIIDEPLSHADVPEVILSGAKA